MMLTQRIVDCIRERGWIITSKGLYENVLKSETFTHPNREGVFVVRTPHHMIRVTHAAVRKHCGIEE